MELQAKKARASLKKGGVQSHHRRSLDSATSGSRRPHGMRHARNDRGVKRQESLQGRGADYRSGGEKSKEKKGLLSVTEPEKT